MQLVPFQNQSLHSPLTRDCSFQLNSIASVLSLTPNAGGIRNCYHSQAANRLLHTKCILACFHPTISERWLNPKQKQQDSHIYCG